MIREIFRVVAYRGSDKEIIAQGLEFGTPTPGNSLDDAFNNEVDGMAALAKDAAKSGYGPFNMGAPERLKELVIPGTKPCRVKEIKISGDKIPSDREYVAEFRLYDITAAEISIEELDH